MRDEMGIENFVDKHGTGDEPPIENTVERWAAEKRLREVLATPVVGGVLLGDLLVGGRIADVDLAELEQRMRPEVREAFSGLMGEKADTVDELRTLILEKYRTSPASLRGLLNKVQGQLGEEQFIAAVGGNARLASSGSQEAWDIAVGEGDATRYVQVKIYDDADAVLDKMRAVNQKVEAGRILGENGEPVTQVEFAVNTDIVEEVRAKAAAAGLDNPILDVGASREQLRSWLDDGAAEAIAPPLEDFFAELLGASAIAASLHAAVNGFLVWRGAKDRSQAVEDTSYSTAVSVGGIAAGHATAHLLSAPLEVALGAAGGPVGSAIAIAVGVSSRAVLRRLTDRRFLVDELDTGNAKLAALVRRLEPA